MRNAILSAFGAMYFASTRGRVLLALLLAHLALALPATLLFADAVRQATNHRTDPIAFAAELDFTTWFDLRSELHPAEMALGFSGLAAFLLGIFATGGWLEVLTRRESRPGFRVFASGAGARMVRFTRLAALSLVVIAGARFVWYGSPADALLRWLTGGSTELTDFETETGSRMFQMLRTLMFALTVGWVVMVSDLSRSILVVRGGRSAIVAGFRGIVLFFRSPLASMASAVVPFTLECGALWGMAWLVELASMGEANDVNLLALFLLTQLVVVIREVARAGRLGAFLAIARDDDSRRFERRYGRLSDPLIAAAGGAMTEEFEG